MKIKSMAAVTVWRVACEPARRRLGKALQRPETAQAAVLDRLLSANHQTDFGRAHGLRPGMTVGEFQAAVPVRNYDGYGPWMDRAKAGERGVLSDSVVEAFERSSGSTSAAKYIPYTAGLRAELGEAVRAWMGDVFLRHPETARGPAWWITSPLRTPRETTAGGIPVGLDGDEDYLGWWEKSLAPALWAVPTAIRTAGDWDATLAWTLRFLLQAPELRFVSVWNPSLLEILWSRFMTDPERWLELLHGGKGPTDHPTLARHLRAAPKAAATLRAHLSAGTLTPAVVWPKLAMVSAWEAAEAATAAAVVRRLFGHACFQPKGLMATEGVVSVPWLDDALAPVPALRSHFLEFEEQDGQAVRLVHELEEGRDYSVVLSTGSGFFRMRLGDVVRVEGVCGRTPRLRLAGRADGVCDLRGEKLHPHMVRQVLESCQNPTAPFRFAMLAPDRGASPPRYVLFLGEGAGRSDALVMGERVEAGLAENPHYAHCRVVGQLDAVRVQFIRGPASESYLRRCLAMGQVAATVKHTALSHHDGWTDWFDGESREASS